MHIDRFDESKDCFADRWGLVQAARRGHDVTLLCGSNTGRKEEYVWKGIRVIALPALIEVNNTTRLLKGFIREIFSIRADVFITHHYCFLVPEITLLVGIIRKKNVFLHLHNTFAEGGFLRQTLGFFYYLLISLIAPLFKGVLFVSAYLQRRFPLISKKNGLVVYNKFSMPLFIKSKRIRNQIFYIGRIDTQKGVDIILKAVAILVERGYCLHLKIAGNGSQKYRKKLLRFCHNHNIIEHVEFVGVVRGEKKWKHFYESSMSIVASRDEAFGNVVVESLLTKTPLIVSDKGALLEACGGNALMFINEDVKDLALMIQKILEDPMAAKRRAQKGYDFSKKYLEGVSIRKNQLF